MSKRLIKVLAPIAVVVAGALLYVLTVGHCFLPLPGATHYKDERLEFWSYTSYPLVMPPSSQTISGSLERLVWKVKHPGHARLLATAKRLEQPPLTRITVCGRCWRPWTTSSRPDAVLVPGTLFPAGELRIIPRCSGEFRRISI